jgi:chaperonin GroEL (HSP60 family)
MANVGRLIHQRPRRDALRNQSHQRTQGNVLWQRGVIQPLLVTTSAIKLATETVCMILKVDDLVVVA